MKFSAVLIFLAATALAAPAPSPGHTMEILRRHAEATVNAAEAYARALKVRDVAIADALAASPDNEDDVNIFCSVSDRVAARDASAAAAAAAEAHAVYARMFKE